MDITPLNLLSLALPSPNDVTQFTELKTGMFSLADDKTCNLPRRTEPCPEDCNKQLLLINAAGHEVVVIHTDEWLDWNEGEKCDCLLFDDGVEKRKFSLCELTCSVENYVVPDSTSGKPGKRAKAHSQMTNMWNAIFNSDNPVFANFVLQFAEKVAIFGWRDRRQVNTEKGGAKAMRSFLRTPGSTSTITKYEEYNFGNAFTFVQVKYPAVYNW